jgi:microcystin-dependent protein
MVASNRMLLQRFYRKEPVNINQLLGEIRLIAYDDIPSGWLRCEGQSLDINKYPLLYMMMGTKFGQDGNYRFSLPDLRGKAPPGLIYCIATKGSLPAIRGVGDE